MDKFGKSVHTTEKSALRLESLKRRYQLLKVAKFCKRLYGGCRDKLATPPPPPPPPYKRLYIFSTLRAYIFSCLRRITYKFGSFTNIKALFPVASTDIPNLSMSKVEKTVKRSTELNGRLHVCNIFIPELR